MREQTLKIIKKYFEEFKTISLKKVKDKKNFLSKEKYDCVLSNGSIIRREKLLKNNRDGSASIIFPITEEGKIILAIEPRVFTDKTVDIGLPAGYIEDNELPIESAKRELLEETGYISDEFTHIGSFYQDQGCSEALNHYYIAKNCKRITNQKLDEGEFIKYILVSIEELKELLNEGYIKGLNSAYLIIASLNILNKEKGYENILKP